jgi:putative tryptophan/tyrosine transport system substrate-binding protein
VSASIKRKLALVSSALLLTLLTVCDCAEAQQAGKVYRIGFLSGGYSGPSPTVEAFRQGLRDLGYIEGKNLIIEYRYTETQSESVARFPALVSNLVRLKVDVIVSNSSNATRAAKKAGITIPVVMTTSTDPIGQGFVASLARPGGNITGLTTVSEELGGKLLEFTKELILKLARVAVVYPDGQAGRIFLKETESPARALGVQLIPLIVGEPSGYDRVVQAAAKDRADAILSRLGPNPSMAHRRQFTALASKKLLPVVSFSTDDAVAGAVLSYGRDTSDQYRRVAVYVDKILKGAKPGDLPVEAPTKLELVINLKAAKEIGLTIPPNMLARADRVIK